RRSGGCRRCERRRRQARSHRHGRAHGGDQGQALRRQGRGLMLDFMFAVFAGLALLGGLVVVFHRSIVHSAFALVAALFGVAGLSWTLGADFLGATQVLLYVGGVTVLLLFAVMLTTRDTMRLSPGRIVLMVPLVGYLAWLVLQTYTGVLTVIGAGGNMPADPAPTTDAIGV